jgi:hypothetical protein
MPGISLSQLYVLLTSSYKVAKYYFSYEISNHPILLQYVYIIVTTSNFHQILTSQLSKQAQLSH